MNEREVAKWTMWCHLCGLLWIPPAIIGLTIPFINLIGPFVLWWLKKDHNEFIDFEGKEAVNFQLSMSLYSIVGLIIFGILGLISLLVVGRFAVDATEGKPQLLPGGIELWQKVALTLFGIVQLILVGIAAQKANRGEAYQYPLTIRFLK